MLITVDPGEPRMMTRTSLWYVSTVFLLLTIVSPAGSPIWAQSRLDLSNRIQMITTRPEFAHANFGIEFYSLDTNKVVYSVNREKMFVPASTTKLLTEGTLLASLGAGYKFETRIYRTGPVDSMGHMKGDLVLVASGDPNLSNRIQPDGILAFADNDHSYSGSALPGDPLVVVRQLAKEIASSGIRQVDGSVLVDSSLFPETPWTGEGSGGVVISPIVVNDNLIDLILLPGKAINSPVTLESSPQTSYVRFVNHLTTGAPNSVAELDPPQIEVNPDGTIVATISGSVPLNVSKTFAPFFVPSPTIFAETVLRECLEDAGVSVKVKASPAISDFQAYKPFYVQENEVADHLSLPLSEEIKVTLKVSQNLHAFMGPYLLGTLVAKIEKDPFKAGFGVERKFLTDAGLNLSGASQGDGAGGSWADLFTPDFMCQYLAYWTKRSDFSVFFSALPVLGKDGTLAEIDRASPAVGHVFAKTGTFDSEDLLNDRAMLNGKGLAGYVLRADGKRLAFTVYLNHMQMQLDPEAAAKELAEVLGEIAAAAYDAPIDTPSENEHETQGTK